MRSHFPLTTLTTMRCVTLAVCVVATACGRATATSPTSPTGAGGGIENTEARGGQQLPFRGSLQAQETDVVAPPSLLVTGTATGTATQLGRFENTFTAIVNLVLVGGSLFLVVKVVNRLRKRAVAPETDHDVLVQIRDALRARPAA